MFCCTLRPDTIIFPLFNANFQVVSTRTYSLIFAYAFGASSKDGFYSKV